MALELWPQFTGGSYLRNNNYVDSEILINLYPETSGRGENNRTQMRLMTTPGLRQLADLSTILLAAGLTGPIYDLVTVTQVGGAGVGIPRTFALAGGNGGLFLVEYKGASTAPVIIDSPFPVVSNPSIPNALPKLVSCGHDQILAINGSPTGTNPSAAVYNLALNSVTQLTTATAPGWLGAADADFLDGYLIGAQPNSQTFFISAIQDASAYDPLDIAVENDAPDTIVGLRVIHRDLFIFGKSRILVWNDTGAAGFPLTRNNSATIEVGCIGPGAIAKLNDTLFWLGRDQRGGIQAWKMNGYNAQRISTPAVEALWQNYFVTGAVSESTLYGAQAFAYQEEGHQFYVCNFPVTVPSPNGFTWVFDDTEGLWHERKRMDPAGTGVHAGCIIPRSHTFNPLYGHIVGARDSAKLYYQSRTEGLESGLTILRQRTAPHLYQGSQRNFYKQMVLDITPFPQAIDLTMSYTHDGGKTFTAPIAPSVTDRGSGKRISWNRLGSGLDFFCNVFMKGSDQFSVSGAYLDLGGPGGNG